MKSVIKHTMETVIMLNPTSKKYGYVKHLQMVVQKIEKRGRCSLVGVHADNALIGERSIRDGAAFEVVCNLAKLQGGRLVHNEVDKKGDESRDTADRSTKSPAQKIVSPSKFGEFLHLLLCGVRKPCAPQLISSVSHSGGGEGLTHSAKRIKKDTSTKVRNNRVFASVIVQRLKDAVCRERVIRELRDYGRHIGAGLSHRWLRGSERAVLEWRLACFPERRLRD